MDIQSRQIIIIHPAPDEQGQYKQNSSRFFQFFYLRSQKVKNFGGFLLFTSSRQLHILYYKSKRLYSEKTDRFPYMDIRSDHMKIERISENQLKLTLTKDDLKERDIKLEDLITPSEKTQKLFRDIMEQALDE
ncbi:MAG: adaptor protein MecA, partial [Anaerotignum sp.]|nr:adaptor protein MecA [Anaerotignum sp.]